MKARFINDSPSKSDKFDYGGHTRSAETLVDAIDQLSNHDAAIGIEGKWGSGKSTVIEIAKNIIGKRKDVPEKHIFCYDLWSHHPRNFRKSFLEELTAWAYKEGMINKKDFDNYQDEIYERSITIKKNETKSYSSLGYFLILCTPLLPLVFTWLSPFAFQGGKLPEGFGFYASLISFVVIFLIYFFPFSFFVWKWKKEGKEVGEAFKNSLSVFDKEIESNNEISEKIKERDPTNYEFQKIFRGVVRGIGRKGAGVVIVFDNIDRVATTKIPQVWADVRSVFSKGDFSLFDLEDSVTAVITYDFSLLNKAFDSESESEYQSDFSEGDCGSAREVVSKTFDMVLHVSPPISNDWKGFFDVCINEAFSGVEVNEDFYSIRKIFDISCQDRGRFPTPRQIINFVNSVVVIFNQWGSEISVDSMALYAVFKNKIQESPGWLKGEGIINEKYTRLCNEDRWRKELIAIAFNVSPEISINVLLEQEILRALQDSDDDGLSKIISDYPGAIEVVTDVLEQYSRGWAQESAKIISDVSDCLSVIGGDSQASKHCWSVLCGCLPLLKVEKIAKASSINGVLNIVRLCPLDNIDRAYSSLKEWWYECVKQNEFKDSLKGKVWIEFMDLLIKGVESRLGDIGAKKIIKQFRVPEVGDFAFGVFSYAGYMGLESNVELKVSDGWKGCSSSLLDFMKSSPGDICSLLKCNPPFVNDKLILELLDFVLASLDDDAEFSGYSSFFLDILIGLISSSDNSHQLKLRIKEKNKSGVVLKRMLESDIEQSLHSEKIYFLFVFIDVGEGWVPTENHPSFGDLTSLSDDVSKFSENKWVSESSKNTVSKFVVDAGIESIWLFKALDSKEDIFLGEVAFDAIRDIKFSKIDVKRVVGETSKIGDFLGDQVYHDFMIFFQRWRHVVEKIYKDKGFQPFSPEFVRSVVEFNLENLRFLIEEIENKCGSLEVDEWVDIVTGGSEFGDLVAKFYEVTSSKSGQANLSKAIQNVFCEVVDESKDRSQIDESLYRFLNVLSESSIDGIMKGVFSYSKTVVTSRVGVAGIFKESPKMFMRIPFEKDFSTSFDQFLSPLILSDVEIDNNSAVIISDLFGCAEKEKGEEILSSLDRFKEALLSMKKESLDSGRRYIIENCVLPDADDDDSGHGNDLS